MTGVEKREKWLALLGGACALGAMQRKVGKMRNVGAATDSVQNKKMT